jgi:hypothetical protein
MTDRKCWFWDNCPEHVKFIEPIETDSKYVYWFKVNSHLLNSDTDSVFGIVNIPPPYTSYSSWDAFSQIENEFLYLLSQYKYISLIGDFNGRTSVEKDYLCTSDNKLENSKTFKQWNLFKKCTLLIQ